MKKVLLTLILTGAMFTTFATVTAQETTTSNNGIETRSPVWDTYEADLISDGTKIDMTQLYVNETPITIEESGLQLSIDRYAHYHFKNPDNPNQFFNGLMVAITYKNNTDKDVKIPGEFFGEIPGVKNWPYSNHYGFVSDELDLSLKTKKYQNIVAAHSEFSAVFIVNFPNEDLATFEEKGVFYLSYPVVSQVDDDIPGTMFGYGSIPLTISPAGVENAAAEAVFLNDRITGNRMGTKTLIENVEKNQTVTNNNVDITVKSYQVSEFIPKEEDKMYFNDSTDMIYVLTIDLEIKNNGDSKIRNGSTSANLLLSNSESLYSMGNLENNFGVIFITNGYTGHKNMVFLLNAEQYQVFKENPVTIALELNDENFSIVNSDGEIMIPLK